MDNNSDQENHKQSRWLSKPVVITSIVIGIIIAIGAIIYFYRNQTGASFSSVDLNIYPQNIIRNNRDRFTVTLALYPKGNKITGAELEIQYDQTKLKFISIEEGNYGYLPVVLEKKSDNNGKVFIALGAMPNQQRQFPQVIALLNFEPLQSGVSNIFYTSNSIVVSSEKNNKNILGEKGEAKIEIR